MKIEITPDQLPKDGKDGWHTPDRILNDALNQPVYSPHEEVHEPLNSPDTGELARIEQPCDASLWFEVAYEKSLFKCERRLDHTGKHTAHHEIPTHPRNIPKRDQNMSAGTQVALTW